MYILGELEWPPVVLYKDLLYSFKLMLCPKHRLINMKDIENIKKIEKKAYPENFNLYGKVKSIKDFKRKFACFNRSQIDYYLEDDFYAIFILHHNCVHLADMACYKNPYSVLKVINIIYEKYRKMYTYGYLVAREATSYRLIKAYEKKGKIKVMSDECDEYEGETVHRLVITAD